MKKYYILAFTFLCLLIGQNTYASDWLDDVEIPNNYHGDPCDILSNSYNPINCENNSNPNEPPYDSGDPCDYYSSAYNQSVCDSYYDSGDPCDPSSYAYSPYQCGGDTGDPCDPYSYAYDYWNCNFWNTDQPTDQDNPCNFATLQAGIGASTFFANHALQLSNSFSPFSTSSGQNEEAFVITDVNGVITSGAYDANNVFNPGGIQTLDPTGGNTRISSHTIADVHTHPVHGYRTPSAEDIIGLADAKTFSPNFSDSYIIAADGTKYSLHISDVSKLNTFMQVNGDFSDTNNGFDLNTPIGVDYDFMVQSFKNNNNMTDAEARERALTYVLKDSGIDLLKAQPGSNDFKKIDIKPAKNADGTEKKDASGFTIYESVDCL